MDMRQILTDLENVQKTTDESGTTVATPDAQTPDSRIHVPDPRIQTLYIITDILEADTDLDSFLTR